MPLDENKAESSDRKVNRLRVSLKRLSYVISILIGFVLPIGILLKKLWKFIPKKAFFLSFAITSVLGCSWSAYVSYHQWWAFGKEFLTGIKALPHLPLEEALFNPLGGVASVLLYISISRKKIVTNALVYWSFLIGGTAVFGVIGWMWRETNPYYLYSQFVLFNFTCSIVLGCFVAKDINLFGLGFAIIVLSMLGFIWDTIGFKYHWWTYYAVTGLTIGYVNIEDFNFFLFAPTGAVSIYVLACRLLKTPQIEP